MRATCPAYFVIPGLMTMIMSVIMKLIILYFPPPSISSPLLRPNSQQFILKHPQSLSLRYGGRLSFIPIQNGG
jgi:hypothetical protein